MIPGHVFVVHGDLTRLVCDEVLIPTDASFNTEAHWNELQPLPTGTAVPEAWSSETLRVTELLPKVAGLPRRRMVNSGATDEHEVEWLLESVEQAVDTSCAGLSGTTPARKRALPLLALPLLGTGEGGYAERRGEAIDGLLDSCDAAAAAHGVDIAIVCHSRSDFSAVQFRRYNQRDAISPLARDLGKRARRGELALFLGAGVSMEAGLPDWWSLLRGIAEQHDVPRQRVDSWIDETDQWRAASELRELIGGAAVKASLHNLLGQRRYALTHALLASLPVREVVTTNFDQLFESARAVRARPTFGVLPYKRGSAAYLLKLHGDLERDDVVFDAESLESYDEERRPLAGLLQGLLLTRHLLFVGSSMHDAHVTGNLEQVVNLVRKYEPDHSIGTIITLGPEPEVEDRWAAQGFTVHPAADGDDQPVAARALAVLLDEVLLEATNEEAAHLLDPDYAALLGPEHREVAEAIRNLAERISDDSPAWGDLRQALADRGMDGRPERLGG